MYGEEAFLPVVDHRHGIRGWSATCVLRNAISEGGIAYCVFKRDLRNNVSVNVMDLKRATPKEPLTKPVQQVWSVSLGLVLEMQTVQTTYFVCFHQHQHQQMAHVSYHPLGRISRHRNDVVLAALKRCLKMGRHWYAQKGCRAVADQAVPSHHALELKTPCFYSFLSRNPK